MRTRKTLRVASLGALLGTAALTAVGYERELSSLQIREAVFLGHSTSPRAVEFLKDYVQTFPAPGSGVYLARAELATPYKQIVVRARTAVSGSYSPLDAQRDYQRTPRRIVLDLTFLRPLTTLPYTAAGAGPVIGLSPLDLLAGFTYALAQQRREVRAHIQRIDGIYNCSPFGCTLVGARVRLGIELADVASAPLALEVAAPDGSLLHATFDLTRLR